MCAFAGAGLSPLRVETITDGGRRPIINPLTESGTILITSRSDGGRTSPSESRSTSPVLVTTISEPIAQALDLGHGDRELHLRALGRALPLTIALSAWLPSATQAACDRLEEAELDDTLARAAISAFELASRW